VNATEVSAGLAESNGRLLLGIWRDSLHVTCGLTACTSGSAPGPTLGNEYGKTLPFFYFKGCAFSRIYGHFQQHLYCACAETVIYMNFRCKFRHCRSIRRPQFPIRVKNFSDLATFFLWFLHFICWMSAIFLLPVCLTYWPRKYTTRIDPHVNNSHQVWSWYDNQLPSYSIFVCWYVTWPCDLLSLNSCHTWRVAWPILPPTMKTLRLSVLELWVITFPIGYHWKCVRGHCACTESRDPWAGGEKQLHFWNARPRFAYSLCNFGGSTMKLIKVIGENNARPVLKDLSLSAHAQNHVICLSYHKWPIAVVFLHVNLPYWTSEVEHIVAFHGHFQQHLYCACTEMVIYELPV